MKLSESSSQSVWSDWQMWTKKDMQIAWQESFWMTCWNVQSQQKTKISRSLICYLVTFCRQWASTWRSFMQNIRECFSTSCATWSKASLHNRTAISQATLCIHTCHWSDSWSKKSPKLTYKNSSHSFTKNVYLKETSQNANQSKPGLQFSTISSSWSGIRKTSIGYSGS